MKIKSFKEHLDSRLNQEDISKAVIEYMAQNNIGFNDLVHKLGKSQAQLSKIIRGEAN